jgi:hypothetical protein
MLLPGPVLDHTPPTYASGEPGITCLVLTASLVAKAGVA